MVLDLLLAGGATGLIGSVFGKVISVFSDHVKAKEDEKKRQHELKLLNLQLKTREIETENERIISYDTNETELRKASYEHDKSLGSASQWIVDLLKVSRLGLTLLLMVFTGIIYFTVDHLPLIEQITAMIVYSTSTSLTWWFGDRAMNKNTRNHV